MCLCIFLCTLTNYDLKEDLSQETVEVLALKSVASDKAGCRWGSTCKDTKTVRKAVYFYCFLKSLWVFSLQKVKLWWIFSQTWPFLMWTLLYGIQEHSLQSSGLPHEYTQGFIISKKGQDEECLFCPSQLRLRKMPCNTYMYSLHFLLKLVSKEIRMVMWTWRFSMNINVIL